MEAHQNCNQIINVQEVVWRMIERWRVMLCVAFATMILFLCMMYVHNQQLIESRDDAEGNAGVLSIEERLNSVSEKDRALIENAYQLKAQKTNIEKHIETSPMMHINPCDAHWVRMSWLIQSDSEDPKALALAYAELSKTHQSKQELIKLYDNNLTEEQMEELMIFDEDKKGDSAISNSGLIGCDIMLIENAKADSIIEAMNKIVKTSHDRLDKTMGKHEIITVRQEEQIGINEGLLSKQKEMYSSLEKTDDSLNMVIGSLNTNQKEIFDNLTIEKRTEEIEKPATITPRNILLGLLLGLIVYSVYTLLWVVIADRVYSAHNLDSSGLFTLGEWFHDMRGNKTSFFGVDRHVFYKHHKKHVDIKRECERATNAIISMCEGKKLLFAITASLSDQMQEFMNHIIQNLKANNILSESINVDDGNDLFDTHKSTECKDVILVAVDGQTKNSVMQRTCDICAYHNARIIGDIYLG